MVFTIVEYRLHLPYNIIGANAGKAHANNRNKNHNWMAFRIEVSKARINNRSKNPNWMVFRIEVSGANTNNRNSVA